MSMNYNSRYHGIPAEIRLLIWKYVLPPRVTVLRDGSHPLPGPEGGDSNRLGLFPSIRPQLLRLNKEIHDEVLPLYKEVEVHLKPDIDYESLWPMLALAMRSPIFGSLHYPWHFHRGGHLEYFLPILLTRPPAQPLSSLAINIEHVASLRGTSLYPTDRDNSRFTRDAEKTSSWWIDTRILIATMAAACLQKGIIYGDITVKLEGVKSYQLASWAPQALRNHLSGPVIQQSSMERDLEHFHKFLRKHVGQLDSSKIRIGTQFSETERVGIHNGRVTFTREAP